MLLDIRPLITNMRIRPLSLVRPLRCGHCLLMVKIRPLVRAITHLHPSSTLRTFSSAHLTSCFLSPFLVVCTLASQLYLRFRAPCTSYQDYVVLSLFPHCAFQLTAHISHSFPLCIIISHTPPQFLQLDYYYMNALCI